MKTAVGSLMVRPHTAKVVNVRTEQSITVNRVLIECSGGWEWRDGGNMPGWNSQHFDVKKHGGFYSDRGGVSWNARKKIFEAVRVALNAWSSTGQAAKVLASADRAAILEDAKRLEDRAQDSETEAIEYRKQAKAKRDEAAMCHAEIVLKAAPAFLNETVEG